MKLFVEGHSVKRGYAISVQYTDCEISALPSVTEPDFPVRFFNNRRRAELVIGRFNRRFATA